jgi:hypothetical protein
MSSRSTRRELVRRFFFSLDVAFFIVTALSARYEEGTDDPNRVVAC